MSVEVTMAFMSRSEDSFWLSHPTVDYGDNTQVARPFFVVLDWETLRGCLCMCVFVLLVGVGKVKFPREAWEASA